MIDLAQTSDRALLERLQAHPRVASAEIGDSNGIEFRQGDWTRRVLDDDPSCELYGLVELMDNNPLVCADSASVPSPVGTLAMVALGPLAVAGLLEESPVVIANDGDDEGRLGELLRREGWENGVTLEKFDVEVGDAIALSAFAVIRTPSSWHDIDELYEERFGRSFFVRREESGDWDVSIVHGKHHAAYRIQYSPSDEGLSMLTVRAMSDRKGKAGPERFIHAMNVMAGFEESLGIA